MVSDRRTSKWLNVLCGGFALVAVSTVGYLVLVDRRMSEGVQSWKPSKHADVQGLASAAVKAMHEGDEAEAERYYLEALTLRPLNESLQWGLAQSLIGQGKREEAWEVYRKLVEAPEVPGKMAAGGTDALAWYADLAMEFGRLEQAAQAIRQIDFRNYSTDTKRQLSWAHLWAQSPPSARYGTLHHAQRSVQLDPKFVTARLCLSDALGNLGRRAESERQLQEALDLAEKGKWSDWLVVAEYYRRHKMPVESRKAEAEARRRIGKSDARAWLSLYLFTRFTGTSGDAGDRIALRTAEATVRSEDGKTLIKLAEVYNWGPKNLELKKKYVERARMVTKPSEVRYCYRLARLIAELGQKNEAIAMLQRALPYADAFERPFISHSLKWLQGHPETSYGAVASSIQVYGAGYLPEE
ncbi:hypothetical protein EON82_09460 [bacterium]|nr:MAG: hypothetical protein EON82_09460 [bacterium]